MFLLWKTKNYRVLKTRIESMSFKREKILLPDWLVGATQRAQERRF
jgi:hypothetical protein